MEDPGHKAATERIIAKRDSLIKERAGIRMEQAKLSARDRAIDSELADCRAAARFFDIKIDFPTSDADQHILRFDTDTRNRLFHDQKILANYLDTLRRAPVTQSTTTEAAQALKAIQEAVRPNMPRLGDIILDQLKKAGPSGSKAAPIQKYIETTYGKHIHDKTVGMTLYRLAKEGLVRRNGHTWFVVLETTNPGVAAPGLKRSVT
jgi:hypothetical protein